MNVRLKEVTDLHKRFGVGKKIDRGGPRRMMKIHTFWKKILAIDAQISREKAMRGY